MVSVVHKSPVFVGVLLLGLLAIQLPAVYATDNNSRKPAALPAFYVDTSVVASRGSVRTISAEEDFQAALDAALPGDILELPAGATFTRNFTLPAKANAKADPGNW